jgi:hypothetical protein
MPLTITRLSPTAANTVAWEAISSTPQELPISTVEGHVIIRVRAAGFGGTFLVSGANSCSRGSNHSLGPITLTPFATFDLLIPRKRFGPSAPLVSTTAAGVTVYAFAVPYTLP